MGDKCDQDLTLLSDKINCSTILMEQPHSEHALDIAQCEREEREFWLRKNPHPVEHLAEFQSFDLPASPSLTFLEFYHKQTEHLDREERNYWLHYYERLHSVHHWALQVYRETASQTLSPPPLIIPIERSPSPHFHHPLSSSPSSSEYNLVYPLDDLHIGDPNDPYPIINWHDSRLYDIVDDDDVRCRIARIFQLIASTPRDRTIQDIFIHQNMCLLEHQLNGL